MGITIQCTYPDDPCWVLLYIEQWLLSQGADPESVEDTMCNPTLEIFSAISLAIHVATILAIVYSSFRTLYP